MPLEGCEPLKQISAKEGEDINLICRFEGLPEPHLTWYKDEKQLGNPGPILTLRNVSKVDAGLYTCQAKNPHGVANSSASLTISTPWQLPKFIEPLSNMEVTLGTPLVLKCRLDSGHPPPEISWQHNERGLHQHSHYDTATQSLTLFIEKMDRQSEGKYTCCAKNSAGMATSTATITAKEPKLTPPAFYVPLKNQVMIRDSKERPIKKFVGCLPFHNPPRIIVILISYLLLM